MTSTGSRLRARLAPFLAANPEARIQLDHGEWIVRRPWNDPSVVLEIPAGRSERKALIGTLNAVVLPEQLSALYHPTARALEFIFTATRVDPDISDRAFEFNFLGRIYQCRFAEASDHLMRIALASRPNGISRTGYRNLESYHIVMHSSAAGEARRPATSFWVSEVEWDPDVAIEMLRHLNFYMRYFDRRSPVILIHELLETGRRTAPLVRYLRDEFPTSVQARRIDPVLTNLSESAWGGDPLSRFLYSYQVLEYVAFYYMQEATESQLRMILRRPDLPSDVGRAAHDIFDAITEAKIDDDAKMQAVLRQIVSPDALWKQVESDLAFFAAETVFDGGFVIQPWLKQGWDQDDFNSAWMPGFHYSIRNLRNALVHAREARMSRSIAPTEANYQKLIPWAHVVRIAASEAIANSEL